VVVAGFGAASTAAGPTLGAAAPTPPAVSGLLSSFCNGVPFLCCADGFIGVECVRIVSKRKRIADSNDSGVRYEVCGSAVVSDFIASQKTWGSNSSYWRSMAAAELSTISGPV